ncbi:MAG: ChaN family lipoprotein [Myxococcota bacterium]
MTKHLVLIAALGVVGCAGATRPDSQTAENIVRAQAPPVRLVDARTGADVTVDALLARALANEVIYVGERHDRPEDHAVQYALIRALHDQDSSLAIGMEMFQVPYQEPLDRWSAGEIDETVLRKDTEYDQRWGYDFGMYRPILEYARSRGLEVVALNAPREVAFAVAKSGLDGVPSDLAAYIPEVDLEDTDHRALFDEEFDAAQHEVTEGIDRYYQAQLVWDETMGSRVAETLGRPDAPSRMVVLAGRVHVKRGLGIPRRGARRGAEPFVVVMPVTEKELKAELKLAPEGRSADFLWVVEPSSGR